jgi:hypothetical protein
VINAYVRAYQTAELDERVARVEQLSEAELMRIAMGIQQTDVTSALLSPEIADPQSALRLLTFAIITRNELGYVDGLCSVSC